MHFVKIMIAGLSLLCVVNTPLVAQSSSVQYDQAARPQLQDPNPSYADAPAQAPSQQQSTLRHHTQPQSPLAPAVAAQSVVAVNRPEPRTFAKHDLVTIIIRESVEASSDASLETEKSSNFKGEIGEFPRLQLSDLVNLQLKPSDLSGREPKVEIKFENDWEGSGKSKRRDTFTARIQAEVIDVKPNGNLVLEAKGFVQHDKETLELTLSGVCRADDITADNTVLSTLLANKDVRKIHTGELRKATKKGWLTKLFETVFNF